MGRELKRVPLDFAHPMNERWPGFLNPHYAALQCTHCEGSGSSPDARAMKDRWYGNAPFKPEDRGSVPFAPDHPVIARRAAFNARPDRGLGWPGGDAQTEARRLAALFNRSWGHHLNADDVAALVKEGRLRDFTHTWTNETGWVAKEPAYVPSPQEVNDWSINGFGHDSINCWIVTGAECERLGIAAECTHCHGEGEVWPSAEAKAAYEAWTRTEPPTGEGYQVWETVSEGSPISPVFSTPELLARHMATTAWGADKGTSYEQWLKFINGPGWAPSMILDANGVRSGVAA
jgi:hypothetical protein